MIRLPHFISLFASLSLFLCSFAQDKLEAAGIFQSNMVLQQKAPVPVWGWAAPQSAVSVSFAGQTAKATADGKGAWKVTLQPLTANANGQELRVQSGDASLSFTNVLVGEVWIAAGQSNMNAGGPNRPTGFYPFHKTPVTQQPLPPIRKMRYGWGASLKPLANNKPWYPKDGPWQNLTEKQFGNVNTPVQFARILRDYLRVPIGIIHVAVSGTNQGAWMSHSTVESYPSKKHGDLYKQLTAFYGARLAKHKTTRTWEAFQAAEAAWAKKPNGRWPGSSAVLNFPTALYNTRIHPLAPFAIKGVIWHQGEAGPGGAYGERLVAMIRQWRKHFGQDFHFVWGTLSRDSTASAPLKPTVDYFYRSGTNVSIRKALTHFQGDPKVALVEFYDQGNTDTHWLNKNESGRRMGLAALEVAYGKPQNYTGPRMAKVEIADGAALITFDQVADGIAYRPGFEGISGIVVNSGKGPKVWGVVEVLGKNKIKVTHPDGKAVSMVAYAVNRNPHETLFDSQGLPASPFRYKVGRVPHGSEGPRMVTVQGLPKNLGRLSLAHVRRAGYRLQLVPARKARKGAVAKVVAVVSSEWKGVEVRLAGQVVGFAKAPDVSGHAAVQFEAPVNNAWITVCEKGRFDDLKGITRY